MRIILIHPNYHSGGAEIAGNWPPAWVAYICGPLKAAGYTDIRFVDAMTNNLSEDDIRAIIEKEKPDIVGATAIARRPAAPLAHSKSHGKIEAAAAARSVSSQGKNNHDTWDCEVLLRTGSTLHELPHSPAFLGGCGCEAP